MGKSMKVTLRELLTVECPCEIGFDTIPFCHASVNNELKTFRRI